MATIRRSGNGWQALIRKKKYHDKSSKTFSSKAAAELWANAVENSLKITTKLERSPPQILREAIDLYIQGPLQDHLSGSNEQYPLKVLANSWMGGVLLEELSIRHFAL
tara:strand:+ start:839 stop:1162 length:324 start_codon:yes stop_codon:yes gene_type:complete